MRKVRIFCETLESMDSIVLDRGNTHYLRDVLRCKRDSDIEILTSSGQLYSGKLFIEGDKYIVRNLLPKEIIEENFPEINLFMGIIKNNRFSLAVEKASEVGVNSITPLYSDYSGKERITIEKIDRYKKIAQASALQCGRIKVMKIHSPLTLIEVLKYIPYGNNIFLHPYEENKLLDNSIDFSKPFNVFSGPEGGFSEREISLFREKGFTGISIGSYILRAETIPVVISSIILYEYYRRKS